VGCRRARELFQKRLHQVGSERAIEANG
jgi:hypothetical protein